MGQYYEFINLDRHEYINGLDFSGGMKLTETSYVGNDFQKAMAILLAEEWQGDRVIFCGDYAWGTAQDKESPDYDTPQVRYWRKVFESLHITQDPYETVDIDDYTNIAPQFAWSSPRHTTEAMDPQRPYHQEPVDYRYLLNETTKEYVDVMTAPVAWCWRDSVEDEWEICRWSPLSLYLAVGNGLGGGDYAMRVNDEVTVINNYELVGSWAGDRVVPQETAPKGYELLPIPFDEEGVFLRASDEVIRAYLKQHYPEATYIYEPQELQAIKRGVEIVID